MQTPHYLISFTMRQSLNNYLGTSHFLSVYFFSIDPQHFVDGSTSSPGYSVIGENPGLFKFWSLSRSFQIIISIPEFKSTLAIFQLTPSHLFVHPENTMNFTLFGSSKAADDGLSTLFNYSPSHLFQKHQASNSPLQTRFPSRQLEAIEGKIFDTRQRIFVPEVYRRLQDYSEFYLDVEGTDIQSAFVGSNSTEILDRGRVSSVAHNNYNERHHGIPRRREDEVFGLTVPRTVPRLALILRHIPQAS